MTKTSSPVDRLFPPRPPQPSPGCCICADLNQRRAAAASDGDHSRVSDCNIGLRSHGKHGQGNT
ncbi:MULTISPECIES: hypothetical protein [Streptomyces]|jgi:hypothetical protein|uniref:Uncharacterized protein n=1 Tax=Streptomyces sp. 900129855 TaxID=3155129 RepID=A0ABV2ZJ29_9ACTN